MATNLRKVLSRLPESRHRSFKLLFRSYSKMADKYVTMSPYPDVVLPKVPLHEYLFSNLKKWENHLATECSITKRSYTYSEARKFSRSVASVFQHNFNICKGDCVALISPNTPEYPFFITAVSEIGAVVTTVNSNYIPDEIAKQLLDSKAKVAVTVPAMFQIVKEAITKARLNIPILVIKNDETSIIPKGGILLNDLLTSTSELKAVDIDVNDNIILPYSSGTTGLPKGVQLTHFTVTSNLEQVRSPHVRLINTTTETTQDNAIGLLPFYHIYGLILVCLAGIREGAKVVVSPKFEPKQLLETLVGYKIDIFYLVPPLMLFLADHPTVTSDHLKYLKTIICGAAPISTADSQRFAKKAPHVSQHQGYGMTETSPLVMISTPKVTSMTSCGAPLPNTMLKIVDLETGESLPPGKAGELYVKGPQVMKGYFDRPEANKETFVDGWLRTGDIASYDERGEFTILDRLKELIKVKGLQVAPAELEGLLREHPEIVEAAVIGVPHERSGEVPKAFVVKKTESKLSEQNVVDYLAEKVSNHKRLTGGVVFLKEIPKSPSGKIQRRLLK